MLRPRISTPTPVTAARNTTLKLDCAPAVGRTQRVALLLGEHEIAIPARSAAGPPETSQLEFPIPAEFPTGQFLARLRVEGAESSLESDAGTGNYVGPLVEITA
jgi:hypothetical protein